MADFLTDDEFAIAEKERLASTEYNQSGGLEMTPEEFRTAEAERAMRFNLEAVKDTNPEQAAKQYNLYRNVGVPSALSPIHKPNPTVDTVAESINSFRMASGAPRTMEYYSDLKNAAVSKDDVGGIKGIEKSIVGTDADVSFARLAGLTYSYMKGSIAESAKAGLLISETYDPDKPEDVERYKKIIGNFGIPLFEETVQKYIDGENITREKAESLAVRDLIDHQKAFYRQVSEKKSLQIPKEDRQPKNFPEKVAAALGGSSIPMVMAPVAGPLPMYISIYNNKYVGYREQGLSHKEADQNATISAAAQTPLEYVGFAKAFGFLKTAIKPAYFKDVLFSLFEAGSVNALEEYLQNIPDEFADLRAANPTLTEGEVLNKFMRKLPEVLTSDKAFESATIGGTLGILPGLTVMSIKAPFQLHEHLMNQAQSEAFLERTENIRQAISESKTYQRSPEHIKKFLELSGVNEDIFLGSEAVKTLFQTDKERIVEILNKMGEDPVKAEDAASNGQDVRVKASSFLSKATDEDFNLLKPDIKPSPMALSQREIESVDIDAEIKSVAKSYEQTLKDTKEFNDQVRRIRTEAVGAGYLPSYADNYSQIIEAAANRFALEGRDRVEFLKSLSIKEVVGDVPQLSDQVLKQGIDDNDLQSNITLEILTRPDFKSKKGKFVSPAFIRQQLNQKGVKQIERDIIGSVLDSEDFNVKGKISFDDFKAAVEAELMPLEELKTEAFADYGAGNVGMNAKAETVIWDSPVIHGVSGHFASLYDTSRNAVEYEAVQIPGHENMYVALDKARPAEATAEEMQQYVGTAGTKEKVEEWISKRKEWAVQRGSGMFGWARRWDTGDTRHLAEMQSDFYQKHVAEKSVLAQIQDSPQTREQKKIQSRLFKLRDHYDLVLQENFKNSDYGKGVAVYAYDIGSYEKIVSREEERLKRLEGELAGREKLLQEYTSSESISPELESEIAFRTRQVQNSLEEIESSKLHLRAAQTEIATIKKQVGEKNIADYEKQLKDDAQLKKDALASATLVQKQFIAHRKNYMERILREEIKRAAQEGFTKIRIPDPRTVATIEGYIESETGNGMYEVIQADDMNYLEEGDFIEYDGVEMMVVEADGDTIRVANAVDTNDYAVADLIEDEENYEWENLVYEHSDVSINGTDFDNIYSVNGSYVEDLLNEYLDERVESGEITEEERDDYEVPLTEFEDQLREEIRSDLAERDWGEWFIDSGAGYGFARQIGDAVFVANEGALTETFPQPYAIEKTGKEDFDIEELDSDHQTIVKKYKEIGEKTLQKLGYEVEKVTDDNDYDWYEINLSPEDATNQLVLFQPTQDKARGYVQIQDGKYLVSILSKTKNLSTLIHETGHVFLNEMEAIANTEAASEQFKDDYSKVRKWLGAEEGVALTEDQLEQFARGFEAYMREGRAPTQGLIGAFTRFKNWLLSVYKTASDLNVELNDEIREVFDRFFTAKQETVQSAQANEMVDWTKEEQDALGVQKDDADYMKRLLKLANEKAEMAMATARNSYIRSNKKTWASDAEAIMVADKSYRLGDFLREGAGINLGEMREVFGDAVADLMKAKRFAKTDGMSMLEAQVQGGYDTTEEMIRGLSNVQSKADFKTAYVREEANKAAKLLNAEDYLSKTDEYSTFLEIKARYLNRAEGSPAEAKPSRVYREFAEKWLMERPVHEATRHDRFMASQKKYARMESDRLRKKDLAGAAKANELTRRNYELAKGAIKNREEIQKLENLAKRIRKRPATKFDPKFRDAIYEVMGRFGLADKKRVEDKVNLEALLEGVEGERDPFYASNVLLNEQGKSYKDITMGDAYQLRDLIKYLDFHGKAPEEIVDRQGRKIEDVSASITPDVSKLSKFKVPKKHTINWVLRKGRNGRSGIDNFFAKLNAFNFSMMAMGEYKSLQKGSEASHTEMETSKAIAGAENEETALLREFQQKIWPHQSHILKRVREMRKTLGTNITENVPPVPAIMKQDGQDGYWRPEQIFALALHTGNESNKKRIFSGFKGMTDADVSQLLDLLTTEDMDAIQGIWDINEEMYEKINKVYKRMNGNVTLQKIQPEPFTFKGKKYAGGYAPVRYDSRMAQRAGSVSVDKIDRLYEKEDVMARQEARFMTPAPKSSFTKQRTEGTIYPLLLSMSPISDHIVDSIHYVTHAEVLRDVNRLVHTQTFKDATISHLGPEVYDSYKDQLRVIANTYKQNVDPQVSGALGWMRRTTSALILGYNLNVSAKQGLSSFGAIQKLGKRGWVQAYASALHRPLDKINFMMDSSNYMYERAQRFDQEFKKGWSALDSEQKALIFGDRAYTWEDVVNVGFLPIRIADMATVFPLWTHAYRSKLKELGETNPENHDRAVSYADDVIRTTQPSAKAMDLTGVQYSNDSFWKMASMFGTFTIGKYQQRVRLNWRAMRSGAISKPQYLQSVMFEQVVPAMLVGIISAGLSGEDLSDEDTWKDIAFGSAGQLATMPVPVVGNVMYPFSNYAFDFTPMTSTVNRAKRPIARVGKDIQKGKVDEDTAVDAFLAFVQVVSIALRTPFYKLVDFFED